ncbi:MAG TPA: aquaporin [Cytophagaceae bacterium]|jgi:aquaporin Z|nr:aquaporin [Cytophagaceae bacterium]
MNKTILTIKENYKLYLIEAFCLGMFMVSAAVFTILFQHPQLPFVQLIPSDFIRRLFIGLAMGATAVALIYSPWGKKSGPHMNPAVTLTMWLLKKIPAKDVPFYIVSQTLGGTLGVLMIVLLLPDYMAHPSVNYVVTVPPHDEWVNALIGETIIAFQMMFVTLISSNNESLQKYTGAITGLLILCFVTYESPLSGFSMNPARTLASAIPSGIWSFWPLYMIVPPLSMLLAAAAYNVLFHDGKLHTLKHFFAPEEIMK